MTEPILHHYPISPYAEKIRAILGYKRLSWKSVIIPMVMPKPDLTALTGGYRKTPVLQIGRDIYCDTKLIARVLERLAPLPSLFASGREAAIAMQEQWSEHLFSLCVPVAFTPRGLAHLFGQMPPGAAETFQKDRAALFSGGSGRRPSAALSSSELPAYLAQLEAQLGVHPYIDGPLPTLSDFSIYHPLWFVLSNPGVADYFKPYPNIRAWAQRIAAHGHGSAQEIDGEAAIQIARAAPAADTGGTVVNAGKLKAGDAVQVAATDYGADPVSGLLVNADLETLSIRRSDSRAGNVVVHFPRAGFRIDAAA